MNKSHTGLSRFGVAIDSELLKQFDELLDRLHNTNRSKAIGDLIRERIDREEITDPEREAVGVISMIFDHHQRMLEERLIDIQHQHLGLVCSSMHVHLDHTNCLEILAITGKSGKIQELAGALAALKGVKHCSLSLAPHDKNV